MVSSDDLIISDVGTGVAIEHVYNIPYTFVGSEADPYVTDGVNVYLEKSILSTDGADIRVDAIDMRLVRNV